MDTYTAVKNRLLRLCEEKRMSIHKLATESAVPPSTVKNILYGKSVNPGGHHQDALRQAAVLGGE
jgi:transcriptional regulator with XRE-family HTH domain